MKKNRYRLRFILVGAAAVVFASSFLTRSAAQRGPFSHATPAHREKRFSDCKTCHVITTDWIKARRDKEDPFPDVTTLPLNLPEDTKPGDVRHTACFGCHTNAAHREGGAFCAVCHIYPAPKLGPLRPFPTSSRTEFVTVFPHDVHQDVIASKGNSGDLAFGHFALVSFAVTPDEKKPEFYNCSICHKTAEDLPKFAALTPVSAEKPAAPVPDSFKPAAEFFKDAPKNHATCFACHYQRIQPISSNCAGCHKLAEKPYLETTVIERYAMKFNHEAVDKDGKRVHAKDCMVCHIQIAGSSDLQALKMKREPEVPYASCADCHSSDLKKELDEQKKNPAYQCGYCHTSAVGRFPVPASHHD